MNRWKLRIALTVLVFTFVFGVSSAYGQLTPTGDAYTNTADPTTNYGAKTLLDVESASQTTYIQFNLSSIPSSYTGADVTQATLKLYVNAVTTAGSFNVDYVNGTWSESTITSNLAPALGTTIAASVPLTAADKNQYILINVTAAVQAWLSGTANDGIALVGNSPLNASFDSKESTTTSHSAELDIVFAGGGTITGVTTASGSGLTGGGTSGTLNLSLTDACAKNQMLQWSGTAWACASAGTGTITGVSGTNGIAGGGSSGNVTLSLASKACASGSALSALPFTCSPFASLGANTFSATQTINGDLTLQNTNSGGTQGVISIGLPILHNYGPAGSWNVFLGNRAGNFSTTGSFDTAAGSYALDSNTSGINNTATGYSALYTNTTGNANTASGFEALYSNTTGGGNTASGNSALYTNTTGNANTASGNLALEDNSTGSYNTASGWMALENNTTGLGNTASGFGALVGNTTGSTNTAIGFSAGQSNLTGSSNTAVGAFTYFGTGSITNSTAIGSQAEVSESNALVLGSINGTNGATADTFVGIGTTAPTNLLTLVGDVTNIADIPLAITSASPSGTWIQLGNTSAGGANWEIISAGPSDGEGAGNLAFTNLTNASTVVIDGNLSVKGTLSKNAGSFQIDHPLDPANKYLYHSFVESPDMMNVYNGNVSTNRNGLATVILPDYFEALNRDFRYQLTVIGQFAEAIVARKIGHNRFVIRTSKPNVEVSWQVTGVRHDAYANAHPIQVEVEKPPQEQGRYLHPELFGAPAEQAIGYHAPPSGPHVARAQPSSLTSATPAN
jgi:hypothetical protein